MTSRPAAEPPTATTVARIASYVEGRHPSGAPARFEWPVGSGLRDLPERIERQAIDRLHHECGAIHIVDQTGRTRLWLPSGVETPNGAQT